MTIIKFFSVALLLTSPVVMALPKITVTFGESPNGFTRVKIKNDTTEPLACFVAIDGHKSKFQLNRRAISGWFTATDKAFNYQNFSTWCDYLELYPAYKNYQSY